MWHRWTVAVAIVVFGVAMAWDSGMRTAGVIATSLAWLATLIPAAAGLAEPRLPRIAAAVVSSGALLLAARLVSGVELRWYAMAFVFGVVLVVGCYYEQRMRPDRPTPLTADRRPI
jgi:hypothetical protein